MEEESLGGVWAACPREEVRRGSAHAPLRPLLPADLRTGPARPLTTPCLAVGCERTHGDMSVTTVVCM